ncbi:hypothetical protein BKA93DRAFT_57624 [Sparassis latifolia]
MGLFSLLDVLFPSPTITHDLTSDLTTTYPPRKPVLRRAKHVVHVPIEIVMNILEVAYDEDDLQANLGLFANCSQVCRDWSFLSQKLLFRQVTLHSQTAYISFQQAVERSTARGRMLGDTVVRMHVVLDHNQPYRISERSFAWAVTLCPNLRELDLALYGQGSGVQDVVCSADVPRMQRPAPAFDDHTVAILRSGPRISSLQFSNWSDNSSSLPQLLDIWPSLKSLSISGTPPKLPSGSAASFSCTLEELRMNFQTSPSADFMKWLLHNSESTLRSLRFDRMPSPDLFEYLVSEHGPTLQSLSLPACAAQESVSLQQCQALRELRIESAWSPSVVHRSLPCTLEHIAIGVDMDTSLQPVLQNIKRSGVMKSVTVHIWHGGERHPLLPSLRIACALRGVELKITRDIRTFRAMTACEYL